MAGATFRIKKVAAGGISNHIAGCRYHFAFTLSVCKGCFLLTIMPFSSAEDKWIGLTLAISGSVAIGISAIITKKVRAIILCASILFHGSTLHSIGSERSRNKCARGLISL